MSSIEEARKALKKRDKPNKKEEKCTPLISPRTKRPSFLRRESSKDLDKPVATAKPPGVKKMIQSKITSFSEKPKQVTPSPKKRKSLLKAGVKLAPAPALDKEKNKKETQKTTGKSVCKIKASKITINGEIKKYIDTLKQYHVLADITTTPRDNDLVTAIIQATCCDPAAGSIVCDADPRHISPSVLLDFGDALRYNVYLTKLQLSHMELGNAFLSAVADSLPKNYTLQKLNLSHNQFTSDALVEFCLGMKKNKALTSVDLRYQNSKIFTHHEKDVLEALSENNYIQEFHVEFLTPKCEKVIEYVLDRNQKKEKKFLSREKKVLEFLKKESSDAQADAKGSEEEQEISRELREHETEYFYELEQIAKKHKVDLTTDKESVFSKPGNSTFAFVGSPAAEVLKFPATPMTADGAFLTAGFIDNFLKTGDDGVLIFEFTNQFKLFKRFGTDDPARSVIVKKFVKVLLKHPKQDSINILNMANTCIGDDFVEMFCRSCATKKKFAHLHQLNFETNFLSNGGLLALADNILNPDIWKYLQCVKLDNQKSPIKTAAEIALAKALWTNRSVIRFSLRIRNLRERQRIQQSIQRNIDYLRQARQLHRKQTGTLVQRKRNKMEQLFDKIAGNDACCTSVELVGDPLFLALHQREVVKSALAFATNTHVTKLKMSLLKLDDEWATHFAASLKQNETLEIVVLDSNAIGSAGITAIIEALSVNKSVTELQLRHQSKPVSSKDEETLPGLLGNNTHLVKLGMDFRSTQARNLMDNKIRSNQELKRKSRSSPSKGI
ncbi:tropomodulin [Fistulifera solaris]|uniref:Tropomodulin n=1 Tax=Fistulifera solaris TaxID=1519565 RepID=A0A1Z5J728_FISSO|nr:tropomodulin [Fistulifera solaris]|eukprot:GAX09759.1 tropomodulin [Fistulifera solaris]